MATTWKVIRDNDLGHGCSYNLQLVFGTPLAADDKRTMMNGNQNQAENKIRKRMKFKIKQRIRSERKLISTSGREIRAERK